MSEYICIGLGAESTAQAIADRAALEAYASVKGIPTCEGTNGYFCVGVGGDEDRAFLTTYAQNRGLTATAATSCGTCC